MDEDEILSFTFTFQGKARQGARAKTFLTKLKFFEIGDGVISRGMNSAETLYFDVDLNNLTSHSRFDIIMLKLKV